MSGVSRFLLLISLLFILSNAVTFNSLVIEKIDRKINLESQFAKHTLDVQILNPSQTGTKDFFFLLQKDFSDKLVFDTVFSGDVQLNSEKISEETLSGIDFSVYKVTLGKELGKGDTETLSFSFVFSGVLNPFPAVASQSERQLVKYHDNHYWLSPYKINEISTIVTLASNSIQTFSNLSPSNVNGNEIKYGPYQNVPELSYSPMQLHFENNSPFLTVDVFRIIEVSHWGNVAIEDHFTVEQTGVKLKGAFSRYDYQMNPMANGQPAVKQIRLYLPEHALDVYYRDAIGNISSSSLNDDDDNLRLDLVPRFPLFGGWSTEFYMGYNLPSGSCLGTDYDSGKFVLNAEVFPQLDDSILIRSLKIRVILPEGSSDIEFTAPFDVEASDDTEITYLDLYGRPALVLEAGDLVNEYHGKLEVRYYFSSTNIWMEPIMVITAIFAFLSVIMVISRVELSITDEEKNKQAMKMTLNHINDLFDRRDEIFEFLDDALNEYIQTTNKATYDNALKEADRKLVKISEKILKEVVPVLSNKRVAKVEEIENQYQIVRTNVAEIQKMTIDYKVTQKLKKSKYEVTVAKIQNKLDAAKNRIDVLITSL